MIHRIGIVFVISYWVWQPASAEKPIIQFDIPPMIEAKVDNGGDRASALARTVSVEIPLSSMIATPKAPRIDQWLVRIVPRDPSMVLEDYSPRTELASDYAGSIQIKQTDESSNAVGTTLHGAYGPVTRFQSGIDHGSKSTDSVQLEKIAPVQAVIASGTILRGRGVYFKLRWTSQQVLEGEKRFHLIFRVPNHWRGGLIDVSVVATTASESIAPWQREPVHLGQADFVVAVPVAGDQQARQRAVQMYRAEEELRLAAHKNAQHQSGKSLGALIRLIAQQFEFEDESETWMERLMANRADPHMDGDIRKLPMALRVAVLEYVEQREQFLAINRHAPRTESVVAKP